MGKITNFLNRGGYKLNWGHLYLTSSVIPNAKTSIKWLNRLLVSPLEQDVLRFVDQYQRYHMFWYVMENQGWERIFSILFYFQKRLIKNIFILTTILGSALF